MSGARLDEWASPTAYRRHRQLEASWPLSRLSELIPHRWAAQHAAQPIAKQAPPPATRPRCSSLCFAL